MAKPHAWPPPTSSALRIALVRHLLVSHRLRNLKQPMSAPLPLALALPRITAGSFVTLHYRLSSGDGALTLVDTFAARPATLTLGAGLLAAALEQCLLGLPEGAQERFVLGKDAAFGPQHPDKVRWVSGSLLDLLYPTAEPLQVGDALQFPAPPDKLAEQHPAGRNSFTGLVLQIEQNRVLLDFNHPLAGRGAVFAVHILAVL